MKITRQMPEGMEEDVQASASAAGASFVLYGTASGIASIFFQSLLQYLWGLVNTLQMIMLTALFTSVPPVNAHSFMITSMKLTNMDIFKTQTAL